MNEELKNLKLTFSLYDETGKFTSKELTVKVNAPKDTTELISAWRGPTFQRYSLSFTIKIPDYVYNTLLGQIIPRYGIGYHNDMKEYKDGVFKKTITKQNLELLYNTWNEIMTDFKWAKEIENAELTKVIFYNFQNNSQSNTKSYQDSTSLGVKDQLEYECIIGYVATINGKEIRYNSNKKRIPSQEKLVYEMKYVAWSETRENFFNGIHSSFENIINKINNFESSLNEDTLNSIIESQGLRLLS